MMALSPAQPVTALNVSRETEDMLLAFADLVVKWTARINLISVASVPTIWHRHIVDSTQLYALGPADWTHWGDLGSGGGFPAIPLAIVAKTARPEGHFTLVESDQRKAAFLRTAIREFGLHATVRDDRYETTMPLQADVLTARALGPLVQLLDAAHRHLAPTGRALFSKGRTAANEIEIARRTWTFDLLCHPSVTDPEGQILECERISRA